MAGLIWKGPQALAAGRLIRPLSDPFLGAYRTYSLPVARQIRAARRDDGMERGAVGGSSRPHSVFWTSTAARIRAYYETMPEASQSVLIVDPAVANRPSRVSSPALRGALRF